MRRLEKSGPLDQLLILTSIPTFDAVLHIAIAVKGCVATVKRSKSEYY